MRAPSSSVWIVRSRGTSRTRCPGARRLLGCGLLALSAWCAAAGLPFPTAAQTINGTLVDVDTGGPISLGLVMMFTEAGDSVTATLTNEAGRFSITSPEPGSFTLLASALGYKETPAGVFELGEGGVMSVEYRIAPQPMPLEELVVSLSRPALQHYLVRNGFVRRLQRGLGKFITPYDIEKSSAVTTEDLLAGVPEVRVGTVRVIRDSMIIPRPDIGETVQIRSPTSGWCAPAIFIDGVVAQYDPQIGVTLSQLVPLPAVEGIEVYRRPAEIPVEYGVTQGGGRSSAMGGTCGVLLLWTRQGGR